MTRELTRRKTGGDLADQLVRDHALFRLEADLRRLELTAARLDRLVPGSPMTAPLLTATGLPRSENGPARRSRRHRSWGPTAGR